MARKGRTLAAVVAALCCGAAASCDNLADLMGRLSLDAVVPTSRQRPAFATPAVRFQGSALPCAPSSAAPMACGRAPAFSLGHPLLGSRVALLGAGSLERSFWAPVEASSRMLSAVSTLAMRSPGSGKVKANVPHEKSKRRQERPSHQVLVLNASYEPLSVVSAPRALSLLWDGKASRVVDRSTWTSAGGESVEVPSVVSLRRYIKVGQRRPPLNRKTILMRDHGLCQYCGKNADNIDHVIPRSKGGGTTWENCVASCRTCNSHKAAKYLKDMPHMKLRRQPGPPTALSWVHSAVWKVDPRWRPYIGEISWDDIQKQLSVNSKKLGDRKRKAKAQETAAEQDVLALTPAAVADLQSALPVVEAGETRPASRGFLSPDAITEELMAADANSVIAAYTGGLEQSS